MLPLSLKAIALVAVVAYGVDVARERFAGGAANTLRAMPARRVGG